MEKQPALQWESLEEALWFKALVSGGNKFCSTDTDWSTDILKSIKFFLFLNLYVIEQTFAVFLFVNPLSQASLEDNFVFFNSWNDKILVI